MAISVLYRSENRNRSKDGRSQSSLQMVEAGGAGAIRNRNSSCCYVSLVRLWLRKPTAHLPTASSEKKDGSASLHLPGDTGPTVTGFGNLFPSLGCKGLLTGV